MIYIDLESIMDALCSLAPQLIGDAVEDILIVSLPQTPPAAVLALFAGAAEITDEQPQTITRYRPTICYNVADEGGRTYAKLRLKSCAVTDNPAWYAAQTAAATAENTALLTLLGAVEQAEYKNALEEINHATV